MARTIHQLYCTHCTYETAAAYRQAGNTDPFEYSTRAGSVAAHSAHAVFQRFEKQILRGLPMAGDASAAHRNREMQDVPWRRLVFVPSVNGLRLLANVCYRRTDTAGRVGSYFAHVLIEEESDGHPAWSPVDCIRLWGADWQLADHVQLADPAARDDLLLPGRESCVNDRALLQFLTGTTDVSRSPSTDPILDTFPERWKQETSSEERIELLTNLLHAAQELDLDNRERLTIVVEPGVAAILFFGILRLLPPGKFVERLSFSTFESHLEKAFTVLTAHDFAAPSATKLAPDFCRSQRFIINTYRNENRFEFRHPGSGFADMMIKTFIHQGPDAADRLLANLVKAGGTSVERMNALADLHRQVVQSARGIAPWESQDGDMEINDFLRLPPAEQQFASRVMAGLVASTTNDRIVKSLNAAQHVDMLELISAYARDPVEIDATKRLVKLLPVSARNAFFGLSQVSVALKAQWLKSYLNQKSQFPPDCPSLWFQDSTSPNPVLATLLNGARFDQVQSWLPAVPRECLWAFVASLGPAAQNDPDKQALMVNLLGELTDQELCKVFDKSNGLADAILGSMTPGDRAFESRMTSLCDSLRSASIDQLLICVKTLLSLAPQLPFLRVTLSKWSAVRDAVKRCEQIALDSTRRIPRDQETRICEVLKALASALSNGAERVSPIEIDSKLVEGLLKGWLSSGKEELLQACVRVFPSLQLGATDDTALCQFLTSRPGDHWLHAHFRSDPTMERRIRAILDQLPDNASTFPVRLAALIVARAWLGDAKGKLETWKRLRDMLDWIGKLRQASSTANGKDRQEIKKASEDLASLIFETFGARIAVDPAAERLTGTKCLADLSQATIGDNTLLESQSIVEAIEAKYRQAESKQGFFSRFLSK